MKKISIALVLAMLVMLCFGCGQKEEETVNAAHKEPLLLWAYYETQAQRKGLDELVSSFNLSQSVYSISWEYVPLTEFTRRLAIGVTEENIPDIVLMDNPDMATLIPQGLFDDITQDIEAWGGVDEYYPEVWKTVTNSGRVYGIPLCSNNVGLFYNKEIFAQAGMKPPETKEEFAAAAKAFVSAERCGFVMSAISGEQGAFQLLPWVLEKAGEEKNIGGEFTLQGLQLIKELVASGAMLRSCVNLSQNDVARVFIAGESAMMENGPWVLPMLKEAGIEYGILPLPVNGVSVVGGENLGIIKGRNRQGALEFLRYCHNDDVMLKFAQACYVLPAKQKLAENALGGNEDYMVFVQQMGSSVARSSIFGWPSISKQLNATQYNLLAKASTPQEECARLKEQIELLIQ